MKLITAEEFRKTDPAKVAGYCVTKDDFFALTSLREMTEPGAAEYTYSMWLNTGRVKEIRTTKEDPQGLVADEVAITLECRWVNSELRRENNNRRQIAESLKAAQDLLPAALRQYRTP